MHLFSFITCNSQVYNGRSNSTYPKTYNTTCSSSVFNLENELHCYADDQLFEKQIAIIFFFAWTFHSLPEKCKRDTSKQFLLLLIHCCWNNLKMTFFRQVLFENRLPGSLLAFWPRSCVVVSRVRSQAQFELFSGPAITTLIYRYQINRKSQV